MYRYKDNKVIAEKSTSIGSSEWNLVERTTRCGMGVAIKGSSSLGMIKDIRLFQRYKVNKDIVKNITTDVTAYANYKGYGRSFDTQSEHYYCEIDFNGLEGNRKYSEEEFRGCGHEVIVNRENVIMWIQEMNKIRESETKKEGIDLWNKNKQEEVERYRKLKKELEERERDRAAKRAAKKERMTIAYEIKNRVNSYIYDAAEKGVATGKLFDDLFNDMKTNSELIVGTNEDVIVTVDDIKGVINLAAQDEDKFYCKSCGKIFDYNKEHYTHDNYCYDCGEAKD